MKNIRAFSIYLMLVTICFSCVKEEDITLDSDPEVIPQEGEISFLSGVVRDTSGVLLPQASVKLVLDELELETEADENGEWSLEVPKTLTEGFVIANKVEYSKSIQRLIVSVENRVEDIYLAFDQSNSEVDLSFNSGSVRTTFGRLIDENANPISDANLFLHSLLNGPEMEYVFNGHARTGSNGNFEFIYEDGDYDLTTMFAYISNGCRDVFSVDLLGIDPMEDLGELELSFDDFNIFQTTFESDGSSCYDNVTTLSYHWYRHQDNSYNQPLGDISYEYCSKENSAFYVGVESESSAYFNGSFVSEADIESSYTFDICTPSAGDFLELTVNGTTTVYEDNLVFVSPRTVFSINPDVDLTMTVLNWVTFTPLGSTSPAYQIGELKKLIMQGTTEVEFSNLDDDSPEFNYVNIVQDDLNYYAGIAQTKAIASDGSIADIKIRFRVSK